MRSNYTHSKAKVGGRTVTTQQAVFELKHRLVLSLNKLADRDTHQIGVEELEKTAESLPPEGIAPFLSCVTETDSEQKSAVRKECVRVMGTLARFHGSLLVPHLAKMVGSIVKRLKDPDSVIRDACVETAGVLASTVRSSGGSDGGGAIFVALVRPLFEALGEQNRYVQTGSALCLARVIDDASDPPISFLPQILARVVKLLKNPHFMGKPAIIELIRSIVQAGGTSTEHSLSAAVTSILEALKSNDWTTRKAASVALAGGTSTEHSLSAAVTSILEALKSNDWTTRKAASVALAGIAISAGPLLGSFKTSCIRSLECCRFDKVKPVRDAILHAIQCWKTLPGTDSPEPSEAGSSTKENFGGDYPDVTSASDGGWRDTSFRKIGPVSALSGNSTSSTNKRTPLTVRKTCPNYVKNHQPIKSNDWNIEISLPKTHAMSLLNTNEIESGGNCTAKPFERKPADAIRGIKYGYDPTDDKPECSSPSDLVSGSFETKHVTVAHGCLEEDDLGNLSGMNRRCSSEVIDPEGRICALRTQDCKSLDSIVTDFSSRSTHGCCLHAANELAFIRKQLLEIETKQSNLLDLLQVFMGSSVDSLSNLQLKMHHLEHAVDKIAQGLPCNENHSSMVSSKLLKKNQSVSSSPRLSTCTPRSSVDTTYRQPSSLSVKNRELWGESVSSKSRSSTSVKEGVELWRDPTLNIIRNPIATCIQKNSTRTVQSAGGSQRRDAKDVHSVLAYNASAKQSNSENKIGFRKRIKEFLCSGDMESAYAETLYSGDVLGLMELMERTGPVFERLSHDTANETLNTLAIHFLEQKCLASIIPWLQQVLDLSTAHEPRYIVPSVKARREFLSAVQEVAAMEFSEPVDRISMAQLIQKLQRVWGEAPCRFPIPVPRGSKKVASNARE